MREGEEGKTREEQRRKDEKCVVEVRGLSLVAFGKSPNAQRGSGSQGEKQRTSLRSLPPPSLLLPPCTPTCTLSSCSHYSVFVFVCVCVCLFPAFVFMCICVKEVFHASVLLSHLLGSQIS